MAISTIESKKLDSNWSISEIVKTIQGLSVRIGTGKVRPGEIIFFIDQLSLMLETGTPLNKSIQSISLQIKNNGFREIVRDLGRDIEEGRMLSDAMRKYPHVFSNVYISMIDAGESGGFLKEVLERIVVLEERNQEFISTIKGALYYPVFLSIFAVSVVLFIIVYVFPKFGSMFEEIYDSLPLTTRILMASSNILVSYWYFIIIFLCIVWFAAYKFIITDKGKIYIDTIKLRVPLLKDFFMKIYISRLMRILSYLITSNVPLLESLSISAGVIGNKVFTKLIDNMYRSVEGGNTLSRPITESPYFPQTVKQMISTGEETGTLDKVMPRLADYYDKDIERQLKKITTVTEPVLLVVMGGVIGIIVISLIVPIFKLTRSLH